MARKAKRPVKKKTSAKKPTKSSKGKTRPVKKTARKVSKSIRKTTASRKKTIKSIVGRAVEAIAEVVAPFLPSSSTEKPKGD